jgi:hypothetical protein
MRESLDSHSRLGVGSKPQLQNKYEGEFQQVPARHVIPSIFTLSLPPYPRPTCV